MCRAVAMSSPWDSVCTDNERHCVHKQRGIHLMATDGKEHKDDYCCNCGEMFCYMIFPAPPYPKDYKRSYEDKPEPENHGQYLNDPSRMG